MISKKDILKMVRSVTRHRQGKQARALMNPHRDWFIGVGLFIVIAAVGGVFNARSYVYYNTVESQVTEDTVPVKQYRADGVRAAIERYDARSAQFARLANESVAPPTNDQATSTATSSDAASDDEVAADVSAADSATSSLAADADTSASATATSTQ